MPRGVHAHTDMARFAEAYAFTRAGAGALGIELPERFAPPRFIADVLAVQLRLLRRSPASLLALPTMPEGRMRLALQLANAGAKAAFQVRPELCVAVGAKIVRHCLSYGNSPDSATGYMAFGTIFIGGILGFYRAGHHYGQLALALTDKYQNERQRAEVSFVVGYFGTSWLSPAREAEVLWQTAFDAGRATGDLFHMGCAAAGRMLSQHMRGVNLDTLEREAQALSPVLAQHGLSEAQAVVCAVRQAARDLRGLTKAPGSWNDAEYDEQSQPAWSTFGGRHFAHYCSLARVQSHYLWGQYDRAAAIMREAEQLAPASRGTLHSAEHVALAALLAAARYAQLPRRYQLRTRIALWRAQAKLAAWAKGCPANFEHKALLVRAEAERIAGRTRAAFVSYARAAESAERFDYPQLSALAHLLAARLHRQHGEQLACQAELAQARAGFARWGASALAELPELA